MTISDIKMQKMQNTFECKVCDFKTFNKYNYNKHILTLKHKKLSNSDTIVTNSDNKMQKMQLDETNVFLILNAIVVRNTNIDKVFRIIKKNVTC